MRTIYFVHILTASLGLIAGFVALYSAKGALVHRRSGMLFVCAMIAMSVFGMTLAVVRSKSPDINLPAGLITSYMVITGLTTVRPPGDASSGWRWLDVGAMLVALAVGLTMLSFGLEAIASGGKRNGVPAFAYFLFVTFALLGFVGDLRVIRSGPRKGSSRLARHLWRMSTALFIATVSSGQIMKFIPKPYRFPGLAAFPVLLVLGAMFYWLWRVRIRKSVRGIVSVSFAEPLLKAS